MGVTYDFVELYTEMLKMTTAERQQMTQKLSPDGLHAFEHDRAICDRTHARNAHKLSWPKNLNIMP